MNGPSPEKGERAPARHVSSTSTTSQKLRLATCLSGTGILKLGKESARGQVEWAKSLSAPALGHALQKAKDCDNKALCLHRLL